jgi:exopolysaccharide production protein ExoQ
VLDRIRQLEFSSTSQSWGVFLGWVIALIIVSGLAGAKSWAASFPIFAFLLLSTFIIRGGDHKILLSNSAVTISVVSFLAYLSLRTSWSPTRPEATSRLAIVVTYAVASMASVTAIRSETKANIARMAEGLLFASLFSFCYLAIEMAALGGTGGLRSLPIVQNIMTVKSAEITRVITPVTMLLGPVLLSILGGVRRPWRSYFVGLTVVAASIAVFASRHDTSKIALLGWALVFILAFVSTDWAYRLLVVAWVSVCALVIPLVLGAYDLDLQHASWLPVTAAERILIWREFAQKAVSAPLFGHGFAWSEHFRPIVGGLLELRYENLHIQSPNQLQSIHVVHPHNCYLQIWNDLGGVGMALFMVAGLAILRHLRELPDTARRLAFSTFAAVALMLFSSYGLWESWMLGLLASIPCVSALSFRMQPDEQRFASSSTADNSGSWRRLHVRDSAPAEHLAYKLNRQADRDFAP